MLLGKKRKLERKMDEITVGEKLTLSDKIEDKDLLLYLGLTNDANPLYIQHDYASQTPFKKADRTDDNVNWYCDICHIQIFAWTWFSRNIPKLRIWEACLPLCNLTVFI